MNLRDELLQRQAEKEKEKKAQENELCLKQQTEKETRYAELRALYEQVQAGNIPQEWKDIYDRFVEKIKQSVSNGAKNFRIEEDLSEEKYLYYAGLGVEIDKKRVTRKDLINQYLTDRLTKDGFFHASFEIMAIEERYSTATDIENSRHQREKAEEKAREKYDKELNSYYMGDGFGSVGSKMPTYSPPAPVAIPMSGVRCVYKIIAKGSLYAKEPTAQPQPATGKQKALSILVNVVGLVCIALTVWLGIFSWKAYHEVWGVILHVMAGIFLYGGSYNLLAGIFAEKGKRELLIAGIVVTVIAVVFFLILNHAYGLVDIFLAFWEIFK